MEKRIFLAIIVSIAVLWTWAAIAPRLFPELAKKPQPATSSTAPATATTGTPAATTGTLTATTGTTASAEGATGTARPAPSVSAASVATTPVAANAVQHVVVDHPDYRAVFSNRGAQLVSFQLKHYQQKKTNTPVELVRFRNPSRYANYPFSVDTADASVRNQLNTALYTVTDRTEKNYRTIDFRYAAPNGVAAHKSFRFDSARPYLFDFGVQIAPAAAYRTVIGPGISNVPPDAKDTQVLQTGNGVVQTEGDFELIPRESGSSLQSFPNIDYIGLEDNYFLTALRVRGAEGVLRRIPIEWAGSTERRLDLFAGVNAAPGAAIAGQAFFGPKETKLLDGYGLGEALQFGWFDFIARLFLDALLWINQATKNYGWAIVVLTIIIKIALYPLQHKSIVSMKKMQKVQPKVEAIKNKYKKARTDPEQRQKMNVEVMALYQKEGINPMAGCLPILLQLPILWGFYGLLSRAIELRGAPWALWIHDLSEKDPTYVLPILMTATMFIQTWITPTTGDPAQRRIFLIMPLIFGFFFKDFPSGLVLYWLVQNVLTIVQQLIMNKWWKDHPEEVAKA